jgi:hypothetical protein
MLGIDRATLWQWSTDDARVARCVVRRNQRRMWWSRSRLIACGLLSTSDAPHLLTTPALAARFGIDATTLRRWACEDASLRACIWRENRRHTWWSVSALQAAGFLSDSRTQVPSLHFSATIPLMEIA